jgi:peptide/nickel transport system permease protein
VRIGGDLPRRFGLGLLTLWLVTLAAFLLLRIAPGDAVSASIARSSGEGGLSGKEIDRLRRELGLNRSWPVQYADWLSAAITLDAGRSLASGRSVLDELRPRIAVTAELALIALLLTVFLGLSGGLLAARYVNSSLDTLIRSIAFLVLSVPAFWLALILIVAVANWTGHFLALGYEPFASSPGANLAAILPAAAILAVRPAAILLRIVRASTLEAAGAHYFLMARAKGLSRGVALSKHAFRTAMLPAVTVIGAQTVFMLGGAVAIEQVFGLPGLGRALVDAVLSRDFPMVQALAVLFGTVAILVNLAVDVISLWLDPRLRAFA